MDLFSFILLLSLKFLFFVEKPMMICLIFREWYLTMHHVRVMILFWKFSEETENTHKGGMLKN